MSGDAGVGGGQPGSGASLAGRIWLTNLLAMLLVAGVAAITVFSSPPSVSDTATKRRGAEKHPSVEAARAMLATVGSYKADEIDRGEAEQAFLRSLEAEKRDETGPEEAKLVSRIEAEGAQLFAAGRRSRAASEKRIEADLEALVAFRGQRVIDPGTTFESPLPVGEAGLALAAILLIALSGFSTTRKLKRSVGQLVESVRKINDQQSAQAITPPAVGELATVAREFNAMLQRLTGKSSNHLEEVMRERKRSFGLANALNDGIVALDNEGKIVNINEVARVILRLQQEGLLGSYLDRAAARNSEVARLLRTEQAGSESEREFRLAIGEREQTYVSLKAPWTGPEGETFGTVFLLRNVTEEREKQTALNAALEASRAAAAAGTESSEEAPEAEEVSVAPPPQRPPPPARPSVWPVASKQKSPSRPTPQARAQSGAPSRAPKPAPVARAAAPAAAPTAPRAKQPKQQPPAPAAKQVSAPRPDPPKTAPARAKEQTPAPVPAEAKRPAEPRPAIVEIQPSAEPAPIPEMPDEAPIAAEPSSEIPMAGATLEETQLEASPAEEPQADESQVAELTEDEPRAEIARFEEPHIDEPHSDAAQVEEPRYEPQASVVHARPTDTGESEDFTREEDVRPEGMVSQAAEFREEPAAEIAASADEFQSRGNNGHGRAIMLDSALRDICAPLKADAEERGIDLVLVVDEQPVAVSGDPDQLPWVINSVIAEALRRTPADSTLTIALERDAVSQAARIVVSDNASPMPFDEASSGDLTAEATTDESSNVELDLARQIVEAHRGTIVTKGHRGAGTSFVVELPLSE